MFRRSAWLVLLVGFACVGNVRAAELPHVKERDGVLNAFHLWKQRAGGDERSRIVYLGGSITHGAGASKPDQISYRALVTKWIRDQYPKTPIIETNAALSGTGSWLGAYRLAPEAIHHFGSPDLLFIEFATADDDALEAQVVASMEGIVRQIWNARPNADIVFVYALSRRGFDAYKRGELPNQCPRRRLCCPSGQFGQALVRRVRQGRRTSDRQRTRPFL
jgi:hypothetical protein